MAVIFCHSLQTEHNYETLQLGLFRPVREGLFHSVRNITFIDVTCNLFHITLEWHCCLRIWKVQIIPEDKFLLYTYFLPDSADSLSAGTPNTPFKSHKPWRPQVLQWTSDLNEEEPFTDNQAKTKGVKTNVLIIILLKPEEKCLRKNAERCKRQDTLFQAHI